MCNRPRIASAGAPPSGRWIRTACFLILVNTAGLLTGCTKIPDGLQAVQGFQVDRYLGRWYEIARLDHSFERNLDDVTAEYTVRADGEIAVVNSGFDVKKNEWQKAEGVARFTKGKDVGSLKVSFFGPFWGGYHVIALDQENYRYAMISGPSRSFLWILSRDKTLDDRTLADLTSKAAQWGFDTKKLIFVKHDSPRHPSAQP